MKFACPCCGYKTYDHIPNGSYEICGVCMWGDDPIQLINPDYEGGANSVSLRQAQFNFLKFGASEQRFKGNVRQPTSDELKDNIPAAIYKIKSAFQLTGRQFFILGDIISGEIKKGMEADLTEIGINKRVKIEAIEFALHKSENNAWEDVALGVYNLTETEKEFLKSQSPFTTSILIREKTSLNP